ncbi:DNA/RNA helicase domain-containing protein [Actinoplanes sp. NPDC048791]|uniref:DNA/RNA helicase domain-containing protein n=1 Tax=Actinoplanes sp. NPDC048791 TaxID=3154623 RepID=UPI0033C1D793
MARQTRRPTGGLDAARGAAYTVQGNPLPYLVPPAAAIANLVFAGVLSRMWGAYADPSVWQVAWRSGLILVCSAVIVWGTWGVGRARKLELRVASMLMSACSCAGLFVLTFRGFSFDAVVVYLLVMATTSVLLAVTKLLRGDGTDPRASVFGELGEKVRELQEVGKTGRPKQIDGRIVTHAEMEPGSDFGALAKPEVRTAIASALDVPVGGVRMIRDRNTPRTGRMEVSPVDMLEHPPAWPGLSAPGGSIAEPIRIAVYQTGSVIPLILPGDSREGRNAIGVLLLLGQSGSGKTELQLTLAAEARSRRDAEVVYIDGRKGLQLPVQFRNAMHVFIHDAAEGERYLDNLVTEVAKRAAQIGGHGHEQWTAGCTKCPKFRVVIVDEASKFIEAEDTLVELAESIRSVGLLLLLGIQRATGDRLPTSVRTTIGAAICMGVKDAGEGARVLSEETIEAGADPGWKNRKPGALYAELPGTDPDDWSLPGRTYKPDRDAVIGELVSYLASIGEVSATATVIPATAAVTGGGDDGQPAERDDDDPDADNDPDLVPPPIDPDCPPDEDPYQPIEVPQRRRISLALPPEDDRQFTPAEIRAMFRKAIVTGYSNGRRTVRPSDFAPIVGIVGEEGLKPPTISKILKEFCTGPEPLLRRSDDKGVYEIVPGQPEPAYAGTAA